jgi:hypothetical protein
MPTERPPLVGEVVEVKLFIEAKKYEVPPYISGYFRVLSIL